jgi:hypothetical protein
VQNKSGNKSDKRSKKGPNKSARASAKSEEPQSDSKDSESTAEVNWKEGTDFYNEDGELMWGAGTLWDPRNTAKKVRTWTLYTILQIDLPDKRLLLL